MVSLLQNGTRWMEKQQTSILSAAAVLTFSVFLSSVTGLLSYRLLASTFYDPSQEVQRQLDAYWVAFQPSDMVFQLLVVGALSAAFIPVFTAQKQKSEAEAFRMASSLINLLLLLFGVAALVVAVFAPDVVRFMTGPGFTDDQVALAASMTRIMLLAQFFFAVSNFLSGMIQSYQRFIVPALSPVLYNMGIIFGTLILSRWFGIYGPVYGVLLGAFLHMAVQIPLAKKLGFRHRLEIDLRNDGLRRVVKLTAPRAVGVGIDLIQPYFLTFFITSLANANLTLMRFAQRLMTIPIRIFGVPIGQAALPFLSKESSEGEWTRFRSLLLQSLHQVAFFALPASVLLLVLRVPIVRFAFGAKNFPWTDTVLTGKLVAILALSVAAQAATHVLVRGFYALHDTRRPFVVSVSSMVIGVALGWWVTYMTDFGMLGLAFSLTFTGWLEALLLFWLLHKRVQFSFAEAILPQLKMLAAVGLMGLSLYFPMKALDLVIIDTTRVLGLLTLTVVVSTIGMLVYIFFSWLLRVEELIILRKLWGKMNTWKASLARSGESIETMSGSVNATGDPQS